MSRRKIIARPFCPYSVVHYDIHGDPWIGCNKVVGECGWIRDNNKCPAILIKRDEYD